MALELAAPVSALELEAPASVAASLAEVSAPLHRTPLLVSLLAPLLVHLLALSLMDLLVHLLALESDCMVPCPEMDLVPTWESMAPVWDASMAPVWDASMAPVWDAPMAPVWDASMAPVWDASMAPVWDASMAPVWALAPSVLAMYVFLSQRSLPVLSPSSRILPQLLRLPSPSCHLAHLAREAPWAPRR